jgi:hypothetical protein
VLGAATIVVQTRRIDIYGRYVGHVFLNHRESTIEHCYKKGIYLNNLLLEKKLAKISK